MIDACCLDNLFLFASTADLFFSLSSSYFNLKLSNCVFIASTSRLHNLSLLAPLSSTWVLSFSFVSGISCFIVFNWVWSFTSRAFVAIYQSKSDSSPATTDVMIWETAFVTHGGMFFHWLGSCPFSGCYCTKYFLFLRMSPSVVGITEIAEETLPVFEGDVPLAIVAVFITFLKAYSTSVWVLGDLTPLLVEDLPSIGFLAPTLPLVLLVTVFFASLLKD